MYHKSKALLYIPMLCYAYRITYSRIPVHIRMSQTAQYTR